MGNYLRSTDIKIQNKTQQIQGKPLHNDVKHHNTIAKQETISTKWISLSFPYSFDEIGVVPIGIDKDNYILIHYERPSNYDTCAQLKLRKIHKYNIDTNKWIKLKISHNIIIACSRWIAMDSHTQIIYILDNDKLTKIPLNGNKTIINHFEMNMKLSQTSQLIVLNGSLFVIEGGKNDNNLILKWNNENKCFIKLISFNNKPISDFGLFHDIKNKKLLLFGGHNYTHYQTVNDIFEFDIEKCECNKLNVSLPSAHYSLNCTSIIHNTYVLLFCCYTNIIYIYSLKDKIFMKSKVKTPSKARYGYKCLTVSDGIKDLKIIIGFIRYECKMLDLSSLIYSFCGTLNEFVYIIDTDKRKHYKLNVLHILNCCV
eukprot:355350_1